MIMSNSTSARTDANRPIRLRVAYGRPVLDNLLLVRHVSGVETIDGGINYSRLCVSTLAGLALQQFIAAPAAIDFVAAMARQSDAGLASFRLVLHDAFPMLDQTCNTRVLHGQNEAEITHIVLTESTGAFLHQLWKRGGIAWFIRSGRGMPGHNGTTPEQTLVLFDNATRLAKNAASTVRFHRDSATESCDSSEDLSVNDQGVLSKQFAASLDDYLIDAPHTGHDGFDYRHISLSRMLRHEYDAKCF